MFKEALRNIEGQEIYPVISFVIFFLFFIGLMFYVYGLTKSHTKDMSNLPFEGKDPILNTTKKNENEQNI